MYESYYGLTSKPFQLRPDPQFFFASKGHKRAMAYLEYGVSQGEGFIVITGEIGAGKTTLLRNLFRKIEGRGVVTAQIVSTHIGADDVTQMVAAAFGLPFENTSKAALLTRIEQFLRECDRQGKRVLLAVDEAQNLSTRAIEELRMLSNFQTSDKCLLQTFLLGQPEFRKTILSNGMQQLQQRVIATYHLGPMDEAETRAYIEHRLTTAGWRQEPSISQDAFAAIFNFTAGIPRKVNTLCDRLFLMGYLEELRSFNHTHVDAVVRDIRDETQVLDLPASDNAAPALSNAARSTGNDEERFNTRLASLERSMMAVLDAVKKLSSFSKNPTGTNIDA